MQAKFSEHRGYVVNKMLKKATGNHFNLPGHTVSDMQVTILEKIHNKDVNFRKNREKMFIQQFNTKYKGLNQNCLLQSFLKTIFRFHFGTGNVICWHVIIVMAQSDEEYIKYLKYITDRTLPSDFFSSENLSISTLKSLLYTRI